MKKINVVKSFICLLVITLTVACERVENQRIDTNSEIKSNKLIIPPKDA